jgi:hypothetical protein
LTNGASGNDGMDVVWLIADCSGYEYGSVIDIVVNDGTRTSTDDGMST